MTANNPDNVGGLPELPAWMDDYKIPCDAFDGNEDVRLSDRMRAYGELCRAAPSGGEPNGKLVGWWNGITPGFDGMGMPSIRWGADAEDSRHDIPLYDGYNPIHYVTPVSAPAGSGEADEDIDGLCCSLEFMAKHSDSVGFNSDAECLRTAAALLRKLQQGAEYQHQRTPEPDDGMDRISIKLTTDRKDGEPEGGDWWEWKREQLYADGWTMESECADGAEIFVRPASQDQEGGSHE